MERTDCLICNGPTEGRPAQIAAFISTYCGIKETTTEIRYCPACDFAFFKRRYSDEEATRLYTNYRGEEYNRIRLEVEPSYSSYIPSFEDHLSGDFVTRIRDHNTLLDVYPELDEFENVLDFGGDGSIPGRTFKSAKVWIDDLSAGSTDEASRKHEFIFASNVFEHLSDPVAVLKTLVDRLDPEGLIFIDVPGPVRASLSEQLLWQARHGGDMFVMHEHISYFAKRSLDRLVRRAGLLPVFEFQARHTAQAIIAVFPDSQLAKKLLPLKEQRRLLLETKIVRALAFETSESTWNASNAAAARVISATADAIGSLSSQISGGPAYQNIDRAAAERELREQLDLVHRSTSWRITAPIRALKRLLSS